MNVRRPLRWIWAGFAMILAVGCGSPPSFTVETVVHPDGSCDRTIIQPRVECLPPEALKPGWAGRPAPEDQPLRPGARPEDPLNPEWVARWESVTAIKGPPAAPADSRPAGTEEYLRARGSFRGPREIPPHYRYANADFPQAGASELVRSYERIDRAFVVEHRWSERITEVVTLPGFIEARDKMLDILLPLGIRLIEEEFGPNYDLSGLSDFIRNDVRRALEEASLLLYDAGVRRRIRRDDETIDPELADRLVTLSRRLGFDPLDAKGKMLREKDLDRQIVEYLRRVVLERVRHRDGSALDGSDWDALLDRWNHHPDFLKPDQRQQERLDRFVGPLIPRMLGVYGVPLAFLFRGAPRFDFTLTLPGELIESNGVGLRGGKTRWRFGTDEIFPLGYEMKARSLEIDREAQRKALGRVAIDDEESALEFVELIGDDPTLLAAVRKLRETGDRAALADDKGRTPAQRQRAGRLREVLFGR